MVLGVSFQFLQVLEGRLLLTHEHDESVEAKKCFDLPDAPMQVQLEKQGKRLDSLKSGNQGYGKKTKKADRLELQLKEQVTKALASLRLKQAVVVSIWIRYKSLPDCSLTKLQPFESL